MNIWMSTYLSSIKDFYHSFWYLRSYAIPFDQCHTLQWKFHLRLGNYILQNSIFLNTWVLLALCVVPPRTSEVPSFRASLVNMASQLANCNAGAINGSCFSWCALFRKRPHTDLYMMSMMSREQLERLFSESAPPILELSEIRQWCRAKQLDDSNLQVSREAML